jgi:hypothetical protein
MRSRLEQKVCRNGHVMHPSWDRCPYCLLDEVIKPGGFDAVDRASGKKRK